MKLPIRHHQFGIAAVEFLITLPLLLLIFTVIVEFGNLFLRYNTLSKSVQNAVRYSVTDVYGTANPSDIAATDNIKNMVVYGNKAGSGNPILENLKKDDVTVDSSISKYVVVTASYTYSPLLNFIPYESISSLTFTSSSVMRTEP